MFKSILLTVDLTRKKSWAKALPQAVELTRASGGTLHIISVVPEMGTPMVESFFPADYERQALEKAQAQLEQLVAAEIPDGIVVKQHLAFGDIYHKVLEAVEKTDCDLIVMGSHAPDRAREFLVGSNADRVVRRSPVSVLVVRG